MAAWARGPSRAERVEGDRGLNMMSSGREGDRDVGVCHGEGYIEGRGRMWTTTRAS